MKDGQKEGKFTWYGTTPPDGGVVLVSEWDVRALIDTEWRVTN